MRTALILANVAVKLTMAGAFATDGDWLAAGVILALTPISSWLVAR